MLIQRADVRRFWVLGLGVRISIIILDPVGIDPTHCITSTSDDVRAAHQKHGRSRRFEDIIEGDL